MKHDCSYTITLQDRTDEASRRERVLLQVAGMLFFAACTGWASMVKIPLPFTPVPVTLQTMAVLSAGGILGSGWGTASMALYALLGILGIPMFAFGTQAGVQVITGPTGGYIVGFLAAATLAGRSAHATTWTKAVYHMLAATAVIYVTGATWLWICFPAKGASWAIASGVLPFLPGDVMKALAAATLVRIAHGGGYGKNR